MIDCVRYHFQNVQTTNDEIRENLVEVGDKIQKHTDCILLIHFLYIISILSLYSNN